MAFTSAPVIITDTSTAELAKYGSNAFLAMRISFANELARLAEAEGADPLVMLQAIGMDPRIGSRYLQPGVGYGGSCLPKDVAALISMGNVAGEPMELMRATQRVNELQRRRIIRTLADRLDGLSARRIAVLGLAFKPGTNDVRESPGLQIARELTVAGAKVIAWDAAVTSELLPGSDAGLAVVADPLLAFQDADAAVLCTVWPEIGALDFAQVAEAMRGTLLVDGRYAWDPRRVSSAGLDLVRIGVSRPARSSTPGDVADA
jgi:UDPglucose 6-dehydrogenase